MTNDSDATPPRKTLSVKRPRPAEKPSAPHASAPGASALGASAPGASAPKASAQGTSRPGESRPPRESSTHEPRAGKLFALDDHMRRMQADMDKLGSKKE